ncbi:MAG: SPOR domain-containing protein [bacterium]
MRSLIALAVVLAACSGGDRPKPPATQTASSAPALRGPDALMLRVPQDGGVARVTAYPAIDSTVWTATDAAPSIESILAFDADAGLIAAVDARGLPLWLDLRVGTVTHPKAGKLRDIVSVDASTIYGVGTDGAIARFTPSGNWAFKPPRPATRVFPHSSGTLLVLAGGGDSARLYKVHPPDTRILDSLTVGSVTDGVGAPLGDRIYFLSKDRSLSGVNARAMTVGNRITIGGRITALASTPSGDRFFALTDSSNTLDIIDRYQDRVTTRVPLPGRPRDLRIDPFGRYVLVRAAAGDSVWVVGIGADKVLGTVHSAWRGDLPLVAPDGAIVVTDRNDVAFLDASTLRLVRRATGGAADYWYPFVWSGFRPRAAVLDSAPVVAKDSDTTTKLVAPPPPARETVTAPHPVPKPAVDSSKMGFIVSFAVLLNETKAREQAAKIVAGGQTARVATGVVEGTAVYRIILGPFATQAEADRYGRAANQTYVVYRGTP